MRQAVADLIDRDEIADQVYKGTYTPLYSYVPAGLTGATESLKGLYGDGNGGPDADKAKATLAAAGVTDPGRAQPAVQRRPLRSRRSGDEYALIKDQLENGGLFTVNLQTTEWVQYSKDRIDRRLPGVPARLVPGLLRRRQLPDAVLPHGELPREPLRQPGGQRPDPEAGVDDRPGRAHQADRGDPGQGRGRPVDPAAAPGRSGRRRRQRTSTGTEKTLDASFKFRYAALSPRAELRLELQL